MKRKIPEPSPSLCTITASALAALVAAVAATAIATAAAVAVISGSGAGTSLGTAIFIAAVLAAAASGLLAACIAGPPAPLAAAPPPATIPADSYDKQIVLPLTTVQDGLKTLLHITKSHLPRPIRRRLPKKRYVPDEPQTSSMAQPSGFLTFHERCGRILQTCDLLIRHFPATRTLCILRTAEGIIARREHRPVEAEPTCESDIDVDLEPVLSAPDLDEALRRLDHRIRSARKYKVRNERLQSTSLVLEAEKRRAIRSSAEQYWYLVDDALPADIPSEPLDPIVSVDGAEYYPKPKARSSIHQFDPTDTSHNHPTPDTDELLLKGVSSSSSCSTQAATNGFASSRYDFTSSIVEMNSELCSTSDSSVQNESEIFSSSLEKETENVATSPSFIESITSSPSAGLEPSVLHVQAQGFSSTNTINEYLPSNIIDSKDAPSNVSQSEECLSLIEGTQTPPLVRTPSMTALADSSPAHRPLVAELSVDDEAPAWSSLVQTVAYGLLEEEYTPPLTAVKTENSALPLPEGEADSISSVSEKTGASSLAGDAFFDMEDSLTVSNSPVPANTEVSLSITETVLSSSASVEREDKTLPLTTSEAVSPSSVCVKTGVYSLAETLFSISASIKSIESETSLSEKTDASSPAETVLSSSASVETENSGLPLTTSSACDETGAYSLPEPVLSSSACDETSLPEPSFTLVKTGESSLPSTDNETVKTLNDEKTHASSAVIAAVISNNESLSFEDPNDKLDVVCMAESLGKLDFATDAKSTTPELITDSKSPILHNIFPGNDIETTKEETAPVAGYFGSHTDNNTEDSSKTTGELTDKEQELEALLDINTISKSKLTLDISSSVSSKIELEFEQLLEDTSPPTDINRSPTAKSPDILELNEIVSDEGMDTCRTASPKDVNTTFLIHAAQTEIKRETLMENAPEIVVSDSKSELCFPEQSQTLQRSQETSNVNVSLQTHSQTNFDISNEDTSINTNQVTLMSSDDKCFDTTAVPTFMAEENAVVKRTTDSPNEAESKFDREIQSYDTNLVLSDCASDSSSMSVSPNPDISFLRTETNLVVESSADTIKVDLPLDKNELPQLKMDDFGFGEPLLVVAARKVTTYVDDPVCSTQPNIGRRRKIRVLTEDFESEGTSEIQEKKNGLARPSGEQRGARTLNRFAPVCREFSPPETNICKPLKPEALRPFGGSARDAVRPEGSPCSEALSGHSYRSLERREEVVPTTFDHSSSFPLSMRVPHRRAFWDYKLHEPKSESPKRQPPIKVTGIVQKCKETFQTLSSSSDGSSPLTIDEGDLPGNHRRKFRETRCFFQNLAGESKDKVAVESTSKPDSTDSVKPRNRTHPTTVAERFNVTGIYQDVLGDGAAKTAAGAPLRGVPQRKAVVATLHSFRK